ncbi:Cytochrome c oxidase subunit 7A [Verticillium dahliae VDG2]|nr:Cytochrome c oxidase subunit 7A [Verticillium dahliae VDG2]
MDRLQMGPPPALFTPGQRHNSMPVKMDVYESDLLGFNHRFQSIREQREASEGLIQELLTYCERTQEGLRQENATLRHQLSESQLDLDDARTTRREFQQRLKVADAHVQSMSAEITNANNRNLYVLVLLDGDGLIFQDHFVQAGIEGGKKAAYALRRAIVSLCGQFADEVEIVAKVCANLTGLARAMRRDGCIEAEFDLKEFALGFTQAKAHFDFIDVGYGKERADSKIKELTRWHLRNYNCKQILLGVSHDAGYAPFLDEILQDHDSRARVTVIEGSPTVRELRDTKVNVIQFEELFRADKLINRHKRWRR